MKHLLIGLLTLGSISSFAQEKLTIQSDRIGNRAESIYATQLFYFLPNLGDKTVEIDNIEEYALKFLRENEDAIDDGDIFQEIVSIEVRSSENGDVNCTKTEVIIFTESTSFTFEWLSLSAKIKLHEAGKYSEELVSPKDVVKKNWYWQNVAKTFEAYECSISK